MKLDEINMLCDLVSNGANCHEVHSLYSIVYNSIQLYVIDESYVEYYIDGVRALHKLNKLIHRNYSYNDLVADSFKHMDRFDLN